MAKNLAHSRQTVLVHPNASSDTTAAGAWRGVIRRSRSCSCRIRSLSDPLVAARFAGSIEVVAAVAAVAAAEVTTSEPRLLQAHA